MYQVESDSDAVPQFQSIHVVHFAELNALWELDRRIPSITSRKAWADARNLKPQNVHSWWYRRRILARKLKIKIPLGNYELEIGTPPEIPPPATKPDPEVESLLDTLSDTARSSTGMAVSSDNLPPTSYFVEKNPYFEALASEMSAYIRSSSPVCPSLVQESFSRSSSPLPPSSPPLSSSPSEFVALSPFPDACSLSLPEDIMLCDDSDDCEPQKHSIDLGYPQGSFCIIYMLSVRLI